MQKKLILLLINIFKKEYKIYFQIGRKVKF